MSILPRAQVFDAIQERVKTYIDRVNDRGFHRSGRMGKTSAARDLMDAKLAMDKAIREAILYDWQPIESLKPEQGGLAVIVENRVTGVRWLVTAFTDGDGALRHDNAATLPVEDEDYCAVAWSPLPDSKALGGK